MKRSRPWLTAVLQTVILLSVVAFASPWLDAKELPIPTPHRFDDVALRGIPARPVFNGSVVPGGVYSRDELRSAIDRDAVVASHYRDIHVGDMHPVTLSAGKAAYVSYRIGARVYWTRNRVWLKAGETVLTDGASMIRARCGNCVSDVKQENVAAVDPAHGELDDFVVPPTPDTGVDAFAAEADAELGDLLQVPFAPQTLASLAPPGALLTPDVLDDAFGEHGSPFFGVPPLILPTGGGASTRDGTNEGPELPGVLGPPGLPGAGGNGDGTMPPSGPEPGDAPTMPTPGFVPPDGGTGSPADTLTTGLPVDTTSAASTGTPGGTSATGTNGTATNGTATNGSLTDGTVFPTTVGVSTSSSGATPAPEPEVLWLVASGLVGLASRRLRSR